MGNGEIVYQLKRLLFETFET